MEQFIKQIEFDLGDTWENLKNSVKFISLENLLKGKRDENEPKQRALVLFEPFFFHKSYDFKFEKLSSELKKMIKEPVYFVTIFTDIPSIQAYLSLLPVFKLITRFVVKNKTILDNFLENKFEGSLGELMDSAAEVRVSIF